MTRFRLILPLCAAAVGFHACAQTVANFPLSLAVPTSGVNSNGTPTFGSGATASTGAKAASNAYTTVNGQACALGSSCTIPTSGGSSILLQHNGTANGSQTKLNLVGGSGVTIADDGAGDLTFTAAAGGSSLASSLIGSEAQGRTVYSKGFWTNLADFACDNNISASVTSTSKIAVSGSASNLNGYCAINSTLAADENVDEEVNLTVNTLGAGFSVGKVSQNSTYGNVGNSLVGWLDTSDNPNKLQFLAGNGSSFNSYGTQITLGTNIAAGDFIHIVYSQRGTKVAFIVDDYTANLHYSNEFVLQLPPPYTPASPNMSKLAFWVQGGAYTIQSVKVTSRQQQKPYIAVVADSKSWGYGATNISQRWPNLIRSLGSVAVYAGQGDGTSEALAGLPYVCASHPQYTIVNIGRNSIANGVDSATWQNQYSQIIAGLKACGSTIVHLLPIPESNSQGTQSSLKSYIQGTFGGDLMVDPSTNWNNSVDLSSDTTHPSDAGAALIANAILASGTIPVSPTPSAYEPLPSAAQFPANLNAAASGTSQVSSSGSPTYTSKFLTGSYTTVPSDDDIFTKCASACTVTLSNLPNVQKNVVVNALAPVLVLRSSAIAACSPARP